MIRKHEKIQRVYSIVGFTVVWSIVFGAAAYYIGLVSVAF